MKILFSILTLSILSSAAHAAQIGAAGCGLGNMFMGGSDTQVLAATTNSTGMQTFGILSGTSNCEQASQHAKLENFILVNQVALANDVARGQGETLNGLADILGCSSSQKLGLTLKSGYSEVFSRPGVSSNELSNGVRNAVQKNPELLKTCNNA